MTSERWISQTKENKFFGELDGGSREHHEEMLLALLEHRASEVEHLKKRISYYTGQLEEAEEKLKETESKLMRLRGQSYGGDPNTKGYNENGSKRCKVEVPSPEDDRFGAIINHSRSKAELVVPVIHPMVVNPVSQAFSKDILAHVKEEVPDSRPIVKEITQVSNDSLGKDLISKLCCSSSSTDICFHSSNYIPGQHKRKLKSLALCPNNDKDFVTSSLDGVINLWKIQARGSNATMHTATDCFSHNRRWPEDVAWHPSRHSLFCTYSADSSESQISIVDFNKKHARHRVTFLPEKPHSKGVVNSITFLPWDATLFVTGGSDHAVVMWHEKDDDNSWKTKFLHRNTHSSAVTGVAGLHHKQVILSVGSDKRVIGFDVQAEMADCRIQLDSKCMSVLPNPCDFNLFMVQTGSSEKQLRLFDFRLREMEVHTLGFKQESSESHSALISQSWSPNGWYLASGSVDPVIHIFDIRYNSGRPSQSIRAHHKRVFKAVWHQTLPHMISISSDGNIGIHNLT